MSCDCSRLAYGALLMLPLECKTILGPFNRDLVLSDVVFDLYNHPNGDASRACGFVWNVLPNQWSRRLVGGAVRDAGRRYSLESGILCPRSSYLSICSCLFVSEPTALFSARVTGCLCEGGPGHPFEPDRFQEVEWQDALPADDLDPLDPSGLKSAAERAASFPTREVLATATDIVEAEELVVSPAGRKETVRPGEALAFPVTRASWKWLSAGTRERAARAPKGTNLVVARRSPDGRLVHWAMYRETTTPTTSRARG